MNKFNKTLSIKPKQKTRDLAFVKTNYYNESNTEKENEKEKELEEEIKIIINSTNQDNFFFPKGKTNKEIIQINKFFSQLNYRIYTGKWFQNFDEKNNKKNEKNIFDNATTGELLMKMERIDERSYGSQMSFYGMKLLKGNYIDNWISFNGISNTYSNITVKENSIRIFYSSFMEKGEIFETISQIPICSGEFFIEFSSKIFNKTDENFSEFVVKREYIDNFNGTFSSNCGVDIRFEMSLRSENELYRKVTLYSIFLSIFLILQICNNVNVIRKIGDSTSICNTVNKRIFYNFFLHFKFFNFLIFFPLLLIFFIFFFNFLFLLR